MLHTVRGVLVVWGSCQC